MVILRQDILDQERTPPSTPALLGPRRLDNFTAAPFENPVCKRVLCVRVQDPVVVLPPRTGWVAEYLDETFVQGQVVPDGIPPSLVFPSEKGEFPHEVIVDLGQREATAGRTADRLGDQGDVRIWRLRVAVIRTLDLLGLGVRGCVLRLPVHARVCRGLISVNKERHSRQANVYSEKLDQY